VITGVVKMAENLRERLLQVALRAMADAGAPPTRIEISQNVAMRKGGNLGLCYYVAGAESGQYFHEEDARQHMSPGDRLYLIRAERLE